MTLLVPLGSCPSLDGWHANYETKVAGAFFMIVELERIRKSYGSFVAVDELSFSIAHNRLFGLLGPNGAGKTSTIRMMLGITIPDSGTMRIFGEPFTRRNLHRIGYLPEERGLYRKVTVRDNLALIGQLNGLSRADARDRARAGTRRLGAEGWLGMRVEELSKGMQQKIQFAAALLHEPELIIMDEPFAGLDPVNANQLKDELVTLKQAGRTILFSTHRMDQVEKLCDSICLIDHGRAVLRGTLREIKASYGKRYVQIEYEGNGRFLAEHPLVESYNNYGSYAEVKLRPEADSQELLRSAAAHARIARFEVMEPSLEQIFIDRVSRRDA